MSRQKKEEKLLASLLSGKAAKKYEGKQVVICEGEVYILPFSKHPNVTPTVTFVPRHGTYV